MIEQETNDIVAATNRQAALAPCIVDVLMRACNPMPPSSTLMREFVAMEKSHEA